MFKTVLCALCCVLCFLSRVETISIHLQNRVIDTTSPENPSLLLGNGDGLTSLKPKLTIEASMDSKRQFFIVTHARGQERAALEQSLGSSLSFINRGAYVVYTTVEKIAHADPLYVSWVGEVHPQDKIDPQLMDNSTQVMRGDKFSLLATLPPFHDFDDRREADKVATRLNYILSKDRRFGFNARSVSSKKILVEFTVPKDSDEEKRNSFLENAKSILISVVSKQPDVHYIEPQGKFQLLNKHATRVVQNGYFHTKDSIKLQTKGLTGQGQIIGVGDSGIDMNHCFFSDPIHPPPFDTKNQNHRKVVSYHTSYGDSEDYAPEGHGTHVAGSVAGQAPEGSPLSEYNGIAYEAKIAFVDLAKGQEFSAPDDLYEDYFPKFSGAHIITNSWACQADKGNAFSCNRYSSASHDVDRWLYDNDEALVLFAAGNSGEEGWYSVANPATNKNGLAIGSSSNQYPSWESVCRHLSHEACRSASRTFENLSAFSSRGPTRRDNRIKPEIVGPGQFIVSARSSVGSVACEDIICSSRFSPNCPDETALTIMQGTSMATPIVAGAAAIIRQWFIDGFYPSGTKTPQDSIVPKGPTIKAMLVHSAAKLGGVVRVDSKARWTELPQEIPNNLYGYGRIQLDNILMFEESEFGIFIDQDTHLAEGEKTAYCFTVSGNKREFRATLTYFDKPNSRLTVPALVNDLDLTVISGNKTRFSTNDRQNNLEQISIPVGETPIFKVVVSALVVQEEPQRYSLVVSGQGLEKHECGCVDDCVHGVCESGVCQCEQGWAGAACDELPEIENCVVLQQVFSESSVKHFKYFVPDSETSFYLRIIKKFSSTNIFISKSSEATVSNNDWRFTSGYTFIIDSEDLPLGQYIYVGIQRSPGNTLSEVLFFRTPTKQITEAGQDMETVRCHADSSVFLRGDSEFFHSYFHVPLTKYNATQVQFEVIPSDGTREVTLVRGQGKLPSFQTDRIHHNFGVQNFRYLEDDYYLGIKPVHSGSFKTMIAIPDQCSGMSVLVTREGTLSEHRGTLHSMYENSLDCWWEITPMLLEDERLEIWFSKFSLARGDELAIYDGKAKVGIFTGYERPPKIIFKSRTVTLHFQSDWYDRAVGFLAHYAVVIDPQDQSSSSSEHLQSFSSVSSSEEDSSGTNSSYSESSFLSSSSDSSISSASSDATESLENSTSDDKDSFSSSSIDSSSIDSGSVDESAASYDSESVSSDTSDMISSANTKRVCVSTLTIFFVILTLHYIN